ncbi:MAG TPA: PIG-L family deacetylase [Anaerolineaceae bacterium]|nr:PIG-L family deacetylase [Anaerolineaceae bacterium]HQP07887.1 PIG-L family deacetylase [Anaerolineaceae bacterium]
MSKKLTVLCASAHPDDIELQCAGTLIRYVKEGHKVFMAVACTGNVGSKQHTGPEIEAIRAEEAKRGAEVIGAELIHMDYKDADVWLDHAHWTRYVDLVRQTNPDVILTHDRDDYVHDHSNVGELVYRAAIWASTANIPECKLPPIDHIPTVFYFETVGTNRVAPPDHYVDISEEFDQKLHAFSQHVSQHGDFLEKQYGVKDWNDYMSTVNKLRGFQCGCKYAEAFRVVQTWPNHRAYRLLPPVQFGSR